MRAVTSMLTVSLLVPLAALSAQVQPSIGPGTRIRVTAPLVGVERMVGTYLVNDDSTLQVQAEAQVTPVTIPLVYVTRLEMSRGRRSNALKGLVIGSVSGAVLGAVAGLVVGQENGDNPCGGGRAGGPPLRQLAYGRIEFWRSTKDSNPDTRIMIMPRRADSS